VQPFEKLKMASMSESDKGYLDEAYPRVILQMKDSNGADVLKMEMSEPEALWEMMDFFRCQLSEGFCGSIYFERPEPE